MISASGPLGGRPLVEDALVLRVRDLRGPSGWVAPRLVTPDGTVIRGRIEAGDVAWLYLEHLRPDSPWPDAPYAVSLISIPQPFGGCRWRFVCPEGGGLCSTLFLPPGARRFASRRAHGLAFASQRQHAPARAAARVLRIRREIEAGRPKGMHAATWARRLAEGTRLKP